MSAIVFIGPTISSNEVCEKIEAVCLPPAAQGDVYRAMSLQPRCIGIIDGYFDGVAAVWHKEILWALSQGVHVFGASSMGALRASELDVFGMRGIGKIYADYQSGKIENDDEVAVTHGPAELDYPALSEPLANIRATLEKAVGSNVVSQSVMNAVLRFADELNYRDRAWGNLIAHAGAQQADGFDETGFRAWLKQNHQDQKHLDALALLAEMKKQMEADDTPHQACFAFEWTTQWDRAVRQWDRQSARQTSEQVFEDGDNLSIRPDLVVDELRLRPDLFFPTRDAALARLLALRPIHLEDDTINEGELLSRMTSFRQQHNLLTRKALDDWLLQNDLTSDGLEAILAQEVFASELFPVESGEFRQQLVNQMKLDGIYTELALRARDKARTLDVVAKKEKATKKARPPSLGLLNWYFRKTLQQNLPDNLDIYVKNLGLANRDRFYTLLAMEFLYIQAMDKAPSAGNDKAE